MHVEIHQVRILVFDNYQPCSLPLKEHYRIYLKKTRLRSQVYIKPIRSNDDDSRKHPLKYICLKCHIWWEIYKTNFSLEFIGFSLFSRDPDGHTTSNFYRFVSLYRWSITQIDYTASNCFVRKNWFCNVPLNGTTKIIVMYQYILQNTFFYFFLQVTWRPFRRWFGVLIRARTTELTCNGEGGHYLSANQNWKMKKQVSINLCSICIGDKEYSFWFDPYKYVQYITVE